MDEVAGGDDDARLPFRLVVEWAQALTARSVTIVGGRWEQGTFYPGDDLELVKTADGGQVTRQVRGTQIDAFRAMDRDPSRGLLFGVTVEGVSPADVSVGDVLQAPCDEVLAPTGPPRIRRAAARSAIRRWLRVVGAAALR